MTMMRGKNSMGFCALALGGLFLCNPVIGFYDGLPDLLGYALLYLGLWKLSDLCDDFVESMRLFRNLIWVSVGQIAVQWLIYDFLPSFIGEMSEKGETVNRFESPMLVLLATFVWAVLTWYYLVPALRHLFAGFGSLAMQFDACAIQTEKKGRTVWERMSKRSVLFAIAIPTLSLLPELSILTTLNLQSDAPTVSFDWYRFITLFRTVLGIAAGVVGVLWLIAYVRFFVKMLRDKPFVEGIEERYRTEVMPRVKWRTYRRASLAFALITVGLLFVANVRIDGRPIFHGAVCVLLLCLGYFVLERPTVKTALPLCMLGVVLAAVSQVHWNLINAYLADHKLEDALHIPRAYDKFFVIRCLEFAECILMFLFLAAFFVLFWRAICRLNMRMDGAVFGKDKKTYLTKLSIALAFLLLMTVFGCVNAILQLEFKFLWWITLAAFAVMLFVFRSFMMDLKDEIFSCAHEERMNKNGANKAY